MITLLLLAGVLTADHVPVLWHHSQASAWTSLTPRSIAVKLQNCVARLQSAVSSPKQRQAMQDLCSGLGVLDSLLETPREEWQGGASRWHPSRHCYAAALSRLHIYPHSNVLHLELCYCCFLPQSPGLN
jgi:hypothetical protein